MLSEDAAMFRGEERVSASKLQIVSAEAPEAPPANPEVRGKQEPIAEAPVPAQPAQTNAKSAVPAAKQRRSRLRKLMLGAVAILALGTAGWYGYSYFTVG